jgi:hypothetical protein
MRALGQSLLTRSDSERAGSSEKEATWPLARELTARKNPSWKLGF